MKKGLHFTIIFAIVILLAVCVLFLVLRGNPNEEPNSETNQNENIETNNETPTEKESVEEHEQKEEPIAEEEPKQEEKPVVKEEPKQEEKPVVKEEPKQEEKPVVKEEPKQEEKPVVKEEPKQEEKPVVKEEPKPAKTGITVPAIEKKELSIKKITQSTKTVDPAEFIINKGSITEEGQIDEYSFTAPRQGIYNFEFSGMKSGFATDFYILNELGEIVKQTYYGGIKNGENVYYISEPQKTYTLKVKQYSSTGDYTLKIGLKKPSVDISEYTIINDSIEYINQTNNYTFTAPRQGMYNFEFSGMKSGFATDFYILDDLGEIVKQTYYGGVENGENVYYILSPEKSYTLKVEQYSSTGNYTMKIGLKKPTVDISAYTTVKDSIEYANQTNNYTFTVPRDGRYRFEFSGMKSNLKADIYVYNNLDETVAQTYYGAGNGEGVTIKNLMKDEIYTIKIDYYSGTGDYTLNIGHQKETIDISNTVTVKDSIEFTDQRNVYTFTAKDTSAKNFKLSGMENGCKVEFMIFNNLGETVYQDNYAVNGDTVTIKKPVVGETYEIQVRQESGYSDYTITIN